MSNPAPMNIRLASVEDFPGMWAIFSAVCPPVTVTYSRLCERVSSVGAATRRGVVRDTGPGSNCGLRRPRPRLDSLHRQRAMSGLFHADGRCAGDQGHHGDQAPHRDKASIRR